MKRNNIILDRKSQTLSTNVSITNDFPLSSNKDMFGLEFELFTLYRWRGGWGLLKINDGR